MYQLSEANVGWDTFHRNCANDKSIGMCKYVLQTPAQFCTAEQSNFLCKKFGFGATHLNGRESSCSGGNYEDCFGCFVFEIAGRNYAKALRFAIWANENLQACTDPFVPRTK